MKLQPANRCIYCGVTEGLTDEHVIPYALWGTLVYPKASCRRCAQVTSDIERKILRGEMLGGRTIGKAPTRHPKRRFKVHQQRLKYNGVERMVRSRVDESFDFIFLPILEGLDIIDGMGTRDGIKVLGLETVHFGVDVEEYLMRAGANGVTIEPLLDIHTLCLLLIKIGFCYAAATTNLDGWEIFSPDIILNNPKSACRYVGSDITFSKPVVEGRHQLGCFEWSREEWTFLITRIWLFSGSATTPYITVIGRRPKTGEGMVKTLNHSSD